MGEVRSAAGGGFSLIGGGLGLGDGADVPRQHHLQGQHALPVAERQGDLHGVVVGAHVLGGGGQVAVEEVEQLGEAGGLRRGHLLRQRRQRARAEEERAVLGLGDLVARVEFGVLVVVELGGEGVGVDGGGHRVGRGRAGGGGAQARQGLHAV